MDYLLDEGTIRHLALTFRCKTTDAPRQAIIDCLGHHPVNHAWFSRFLADGHPNDWQVYLSLTKHFRNDAEND